MSDKATTSGRTCPNGHTVSAQASFCERCGSPMARRPRHLMHRAGHSAVSAGSVPLVKRPWFWITAAAALVIVAVCAIVIVANSNSGTPSSSPANAANSNHAGNGAAATPPTFSQVLSALQSTGVTLCPVPTGNPYEHEYQATQSVCENVGKGPNDLVYIFVANSASQLQGMMTGPMNLTKQFGGYRIAMTDGAVGVVEGGGLISPSETANALRTLGFTTYDATGTTGGTRG